jgi:riboflavin kinase/FMN adenylyltransferase
VQVIRSFINLKPEHRGCVATIGNFDGVHLGHQSVLAALREEARSRRLPSTLILFEPQPMEFFQPQAAPPRLTRLREKLEVIRHQQIDRVLVLPFNRQLADMPAEDFVQRLLVAGLAVQHLYVGDDFHFGHRRQGNFAMLEQQGRDHGFSVSSLQTVALADQRISSSRIRAALQAGDLGTAEACLGRTYSVCGKVGHGHKRGRTIGFPTANIQLLRRRSPVHGVYAVRLWGIGEGSRNGVANVGNRPTLQGQQQPLLEIHLFDFDQDIYGVQVRVEFLSHLRDERKFDSFEFLRQQILKDCQQAREFFAASTM